jgi:hypothetical protein
LPVEAELLTRVFFGRVPAVIRAAIPTNGRLELGVPERPWLVCLPRPVAQISINGHHFDTRTSGDFSLVGAGDLDEVVDEPGVAGSSRVVLEGPSGAIVRIMLPFNALAFNSGIIRLSGDALVSVAGPARPATRSIRSTCA